MGCDSDRTGSRTATSMWCGEGLVQIEVQHIESHISRTDDSDERIHIRTVIIQQTAAFMHQGRDFLDILLKQPKSVRVGHHDSCNGIVKQRLQILDIYKPVGLGLHLHDLQTTYRSRSRIGTMNLEIAGSPRNSFRTSVGYEFNGGKALNGLGGDKLTEPYQTKNAI